MTNNNMMSREQKMQAVRETGFALIDVGLFLDTHPCDEKALEYFNKYQQMYKEAVHDYEKHYGPMTINGVDTCNEWTWTEGPWPWEGGCS